MKNVRNEADLVYLTGDPMIGKLDFVIVGPQRTGTSWLDRALRTHPDIALPSLTKETFAFDSEKATDTSKYFQRYFANAEPTQKAGEVGPTYFHNPVARARLRAEFPRLKIIILLRNPVARTYSLFRHEVAKGRSPDDLYRAIEQNPEIIESGRYAKHVPAWQRDFGEDNVLLLRFEDIESRGEHLITDVQSFFGVIPRPLDPKLLEKYGFGVVPRIQILATLAARLARILRQAGLDRLVEIAKRMGLKPLFFRGGDASKLDMTEEQRAFLEKVHADDITFLANSDRNLYERKH